MIKSEIFRIQPFELDHINKVLRESDKVTQMRFANDEDDRLYLFLEYVIIEREEK